MVETYTKISGLWIDPNTKFCGKQPRSVPATVGASVRMLEEQVMHKVNDAYSLVPPLQRDDMAVDQYTGTTLLPLLSFRLIYYRC